MSASATGDRPPEQDRERIIRYGEQVKVRGEDGVELGQCLFVGQASQTRGGSWDWSGSLINRDLKSPGFLTLITGEKVTLEFGDGASGTVVVQHLRPTGGVGWVAAVFGSGDPPRAGT